MRVTIIIEVAFVRNFYSETACTVHFSGTEVRLGFQKRGGQVQERRHLTCTKR
jgi:hypothetical protein